MLQGWNTNFSGIPAIMGRGDLVISDSLNHNSIVAGARTSGATVKVFKHGEYDALEALVRQCIVQGQDRSGRAWRRVFILVEGVYSMEGTVANLPEVVRIAKKYKCYTFVDEAHSIGALGPHGKGICDHWGINPADVDVLMGTFTKSFGAMGGYIAGSHQLCAVIRAASSGVSSDTAMAPAVCQQILTSLGVIEGEDGTDTGLRKIEALRANSNYMRAGLTALGLEVGGEDDSPIVPVIIYNASKLTAFSRMCLEQGLAVVAVGFPATPLISARMRFCLSAGHTKADLDKALVVIKEVAAKTRVRYAVSPLG